LDFNGRDQFHEILFHHLNEMKKLLRGIADFNLSIFERYLARCRWRKMDRCLLFNNSPLKIAVHHRTSKCLAISSFSGKESIASITFSICLVDLVLGSTTNQSNKESFPPFMKASSAHSILIILG